MVRGSGRRWASGTNPPRPGLASCPTALLVYPLWGSVYPILTPAASARSDYSDMLLTARTIVAARASARKHCRTAFPSAYALLFACLAFALFCLVDHLRFRATVHNRTQHATVPGERDCGVNVIYMMFRILNRPKPYAEVRAACPVGPGEISLRSLADACGHLGQPVDIYQLEAADLSRVTFPIIAHTRFGPSQLGHYVVLTRLRDGRVEYIDGTTGLTASWSLARCRNIWTGYSVCPRRSISNWHLLCIWVVLSLDILLAFTFTTMYIRRGAQKHPAMSPERETAALPSERRL